MTVTINGTTGVDQIQTGVVAQADLAPNVAGNGPCFSVYRITNQAVIGSANTKVLFDAAEFNIGTGFTLGTGRFQPTTAGYYQLNASIQVGGNPIVGARVDIFKNGLLYKNGNNLAVTAGLNINSTGLVLLNGYSDYVELYVSISGTSPIIQGATGNQTWFDGFLSRSA